MKMCNSEIYQTEREVAEVSISICNKVKITYYCAIVTSASELGIILNKEKNNNWID